MWFVPYRRDALSRSERVRLRDALLGDRVALHEVGRMPNVTIRMEDTRSETDDGRRTSGVTLPLDRLDPICVGDLLEVRRPAGYKTDPRISGLFAFASEWGAYHVIFESQAERWHLLDAVWRDARFVSTQPCLLEWVFERLRIQHVPDILIEREDGSRLLVDVHATTRDGSDEPDFLIKASLTAVVAERLGWDYELVSPLPGQRARNLEHFSGFARTSTRVRAAADRIAETLTLPWSIGGVLEVAETLGIDASIAKAALYHLIWHRRLWVDLNAPVRSHTVLRGEPTDEDGAKPWARQPWKA